MSLPKNELKLNQKFKRKWLTALRSGKYKQGEGVLKVKGKQEFCCLGVACDIAGIPRGKVCGLGLPSELSKELQLRLPPFFRDEAFGGNDKCDDYMRTLASMNDEGTSFEDIADEIENTFKVKKSKKKKYT